MAFADWWDRIKTGTKNVFDTYVRWSVNPSGLTKEVNAKAFEPVYKKSIQTVSNIFSGLIGPFKSWIIIILIVAIVVLLALRKVKL